MAVREEVREAWDGFLERTKDRRRDGDERFRLAVQIGDHPGHILYRDSEYLYSSNLSERWILIGGWSEPAESLAEAFQFAFDKASVESVMLP